MTAEPVSKARENSSLLARLRDDERGATAVEFGIISVPFITMLLGIMSVCVYFFTVLEIENAVWQGARDIRTGAYQLNQGQYLMIVNDPDAANKKKAEFKRAICERMRDLTSCMAALRVQVQSLAGFDGANFATCKDGDNNLISNDDANNNFDAGDRSEVVLVTACYSWQLGASLPFLKLGNLADGSFLIQASTAFRSEPF